MNRCSLNGTSLQTVMLRGVYDIELFKVHVVVGQQAADISNCGSEQGGESRNSSNSMELRPSDPSHPEGQFTATAAAAAATEEAHPSKAEEDPVIRDAMLARLRFRRALHQVISIEVWTCAVFLGRW